MNRILSASALALFVISMASNNVIAAEWKPKGPIKMMIAFRAGGGADTQARLIAAEIEKRRGWKLIPEQVTGKGGTVLLSKIKKQPNDGSVIGIVVSESLGYNMIAAKRAKLSLKDFTPIVTTSGVQMGIVSLTKSGWKSLGDVIKAAKGGKKIRFGVMSAKLGDIAYLLGKAQGVQFNIVTVRGGKAVMNGLNAGDFDIGFGAGIQTKAVLAGTMVNLASAMKRPLKVSPKAPLIETFGVPFENAPYFMFVAPAGIPKDAREALANAIGEIARDKKTKAGAFIAKAFGGAATISGPKLQKFLEDGVKESAKLMKAVK